MLARDWYNATIHRCATLADYEGQCETYITLPYINAVSSQAISTRIKEGTAMVSHALQVQLLYSCSS